MKSYLLKKMQKNEYYLRHIVQRNSNRSFGIQLLNRDNQPLTSISHSNFDTWNSKNYLVSFSSRRVPGAPDLRYRKYKLNKKYQLSLDMFDIQVDELQHNWTSYFNSNFELISKSDWNQVEELLQNMPILQSLDELLLLSKFLIPVTVAKSEYPFFEKYSSHSLTIPTGEQELIRLYSSYIEVAIEPIPFEIFEDILHAFCKLIKLQSKVMKYR
jgi:hypothetical protein